ncbi:MAG: hypothetical protein IJJ33_01640, partial [Victivallales bacterium]|nr:hypothetical protein [Victivallales bacterium]
TFPPGARITHYPKAGRLVVCNTPENLNKVEKILQELNITPRQVSIEAKVVEIEQTTLNTLGFDWSFLAGTTTYNSADASHSNHYLTRSNNDARHTSSTGIGKASSSFQLGLGKETTSLTNGIRFATDFFADMVDDSLFNVYSIIGNYAFNTVIHALEQEGQSDVLSAPKVTTISGNTAQIKVVTVRYFPQSWSEPEITTGSGDNASDSYTPSTPQDFEAMDIGVLLDVTPTVSSDGYSIDMDVWPQVVDFLGYDTSFNTVQIINGKEYEMKTGMMPILSKREARTKVVVWDGETIVLGGMIQERMEKYEDRVPFLGRLPFLGKLFTSTGEKSVKTNLLIFVNARLVTPAGIPIRPNDMRGLPDFRH